MRNRNHWIGKANILLVVAALWLILAAFLALQFWPHVPDSTVKWALFVVFVPPLYVLGEDLFGRLLSPKHGAALSSRRFSVRRILVALSVVLAISALGWWLSRLVASP